MALLPSSRAKTRLIARAKTQCEAMRSMGAISGVVFRAFLAPAGGHGGYLRRRTAASHRARFDVVILVEAYSSDSIEEIRGSAAWHAIECDASQNASYFEVFSATNVKRINDVNHSRDGVFLFNFFEAEDVQQNLNVWEYTAGWFQEETALDNSTVLLPDTSTNTTYSIVNHCRWDRLRDVLPALLFKRSFRTYVLRHFDANDTAAMPILYHLA